MPFLSFKRRDSMMNAFKEQRICIPGDTAELAKVRNFVEMIARRCGFTEEGAYKIVIAVDEACSNLIRHSYKLDSSRQLCVQVEVVSNSLTIKIIDTGNSFNPLNVPPPDMGEYFRKFMRGGLGVHIIRQLIDQVEYIPADSSHPFNILKLVKSLE